MRILITGASGQLGKALEKGLKDEHLLVLMNAGDLDISRAGSVEEKLLGHRPELVINAAAYTDVDGCEENPVEAYRVNALGPANLAVVTGKMGIPLVHISTDYVFGAGNPPEEGGRIRPYKESDPVAPLSIYGKSKRQGEILVMRHNPRHFIVRTAWLYGDGRNFVKTMLTLAKTRNEISVVMDQVGSPTSTRELVKGIERLIGSEAYGIYHGTCEGTCSWYGFAREIFALTGQEVKVKPCTTEEYPTRAARPPYSGLENGRFRTECHYTFKPWQEALKEYLQERGDDE
jgi:dTDP-4-dehydrorhamnose reductase